MTWDASAADEGFEAVVDGREAEPGHGLARPLEDLVDGRVVALGEQDGEDDLALRRHFLPAPGQGFLKIFPVVFAEILNHSKQGMSLNETKVQ